MLATNAPASNKPVNQMNVYKLRTHISGLMRQDFSDRLAELERLMKEAVCFLEQKETKPPRSDFWDLRVLILKENQSKYNRINNTEVVAAIYCALQLQIQRCGGFRGAARGEELARCDRNHRSVSKE